MVAVPPESESPTEIRSLDVLVKEVGELLPQQAPLHAFVHHNTLHHFEHLPFEEAAISASKILGTEGFQSEADFRSHLESGRILDRDLVETIKADEGASDREVFEGGPTDREFRIFRLRNLFEIPTGATLRWQLKEGDVASRGEVDICLDRQSPILTQGSEANDHTLLWDAFERVTPVMPDADVGPRWRDRLNDRWGSNTDDWVHPLLIRLSAAFLDQGIAYWNMPDRDRGFLSAVRRLYGRRFGPPFPWADGLARAFEQHEKAGWSAEETVEWALAEMCVSDVDREGVIRSTLLSLRGWAGMMREIELHPDRAPVEAQPATLMDYLAIQMSCDLFAAKAVVRSQLGAGKTLADVDDEPRPPAEQNLSLVYEAYTLAKLSDIPFGEFQSTELAKSWMRAVRDFDSIARRRVLHRAYERRHRVEVLDAIACASVPALKSKESAPLFQAIFCIDDREESLRRHLEHVEPDVETFGYAGFFGVAMNYQGLDDVRSKPLCPVVVNPHHWVKEVAASPKEASSYPQALRRHAVARHATSVGARTLVRGGLLSSLVGPLSIIPLVGHALFPRAAHRVGRWFGAVGIERPTTRLAIEASADLDVEAAIRNGYSPLEMADIVESALRTMSLDPSKSSVVIVVGHGSSSLNNPHEAAHDCGATGGGRGGPNARAFAGMANHCVAREILATRRITIPKTTWFVGAYHNTCDDSMTFYDEDLVPDSVKQELDVAKDRFRDACEMDAHERCRRFETAPLDVSVKQALRDVQAHAVDLAQPRPEYGHATNAVCIVGRRQLTRNLFLDRRAFLVSYDPTSDPKGELLAPLLLSVGPVGAGINLEYYFSFVDSRGYGSGTKLPHNITGLLGVMDGHASDLRTGLPWQMVEIHEPVRLLTIVEASQSTLEGILEEHDALRGLVSNGWIQFVSRDPESGSLAVFEKGGFRPYLPEATGRAVARDSVTYYRGHREHLPPVWLDDAEAM